MYTDSINDLVGTLFGLQYATLLQTFTVWTTGQNGFHVLGFVCLVASFETDTPKQTFVVQVMTSEKYTAHDT